MMKEKITENRIYNEFIYNLKNELKAVIKECCLLTRLTNKQTEDILNLLNSNLNIFVSNFKKSYVTDILRFLSEILGIYKSEQIAKTEYIYSKYMGYNDFGLDTAFLIIQPINLYSNTICFNIRTNQFLYVNLEYIQKFVSTFDNY